MRYHRILKWSLQLAEGQCTIISTNIPLLVLEQEIHSLLSNCPRQTLPKVHYLNSKHPNQCHPKFIIQLIKKQKLVEILGRKKPQLRISKVSQDLLQKDHKISKTQLELSDRKLTKWSRKISKQWNFLIWLNHFQRNKRNFRRKQTCRGKPFKILIVSKLQELLFQTEDRQLSIVERLPKEQDLKILQQRKAFNLLIRNQCK